MEWNPHKTPHGGHETNRSIDRPNQYSLISFYYKNLRFPHYVTKCIINESSAGSEGPTSCCTGRLMHLGLGISWQKCDWMEQSSHGLNILQQGSQVAEQNHQPIKTNLTTLITRLRWLNQPSASRRFFSRRWSSLCQKLKIAQVAFLPTPSYFSRVMSRVPSSLEQ